MFGGWVVAALSALLLLVALAAGVLLWGLRRKYPPVLDTVRRFARDVSNPRLLKTAGQPGSIAAILRHKGRSSGSLYETPVTAVAGVGGFVIALTYGANTDWMKNLLAAGSAVLVHDGQTHPVDRPKVVPLAEAIQDFPPGVRMALRLFGAQECVRLHTAANSP
ncbi:nitroreductase family deazaflavin-dependent oxidoreductase [Kineosporia sp. A_224]|uniref:nitroreductase family deazaflavin-dependent oxidoreductase n=1 Tax=Kineosporia sp. A_224 TaxID=1962180 RepID=UPI000B4A712E|nr:nitroreductase family deazaflavin-dependent oxidoreductase [Kineosporia sp. A_224]